MDNARLLFSLNLDLDLNLAELQSVFIASAFIMSYLEGDL